jgi:hypothetical protein
MVLRVRYHASPWAYFKGKEARTVPGLTMARALPPGVAGLAHQGKNFAYVHLPTELPGQGEIGSGLQRHRRLGALA